MKSLKTIQTLSIIGKVLSKIAFIFSVIGFCGCVVGIISLNFSNGSIIKIGGVTLHGFIFDDLGSNIKGVALKLSVWMIICTGEAVVAKFAEVYFKNELKAGTPFTLAGAKELMRLGILTLAIPTGCMIVGSIIEEILAGIMNAEKAVNIDMYFDNEVSIALGIMFIIGSLLCRYGAELKKGEENK